MVAKRLVRRWPGTASLPTWLVRASKDTRAAVEFRQQYQPDYSEGLSAISVIVKSAGEPDQLGKLHTSLNVSGRAS